MGILGYHPELVEGGAGGGFGSATKESAHLVFYLNIATMTNHIENKEPRKPRKENLIFTIWVATGYTVLVITMISWMVYMEFFM